MQKIDTGVASGQYSLSSKADTKQYAAGELHTAELATFVHSVATTLQAAIAEAAERPELRAKLLNQVTLAKLQEACINHSTICTQVNANALGYAEALMHLRAEALQVKQVSIERYCVLAHINEVLGCKQYKELVLQASKDCESHLCVLLEAMMCCATAYIMDLPYPTQWPAPAAAIVNYKASHTKVHQGWL